MPSPLEGRSGDGKNGNNRTAADNQKRYSIVKNKSKDLRKNISQKNEGLIQCNPNSPGLQNYLS